MQIYFDQLNIRLANRGQLFLAKCFERLREACYLELLLVLLKICYSSGIMLDGLHL